MAFFRARQLRNNLTEPEVMLWSRLKHLRAHGYHFRRQAPFKGFFLDFVAFNHRLIIELDGSHHSEGAHELHDRHRDGVLERAGFLVLRYPNGAVRRNLSAVMDDIFSHLETRTPVRECRAAAASNASPKDASPP